MRSRLFTVSLCGLFFSGLTYAYCILTVQKAFYSAITISFLAVLLCIFAANVLRILRAAELDPHREVLALVLYAAALHGALVLGFFLSGHPETALWVTDSYVMHVPGAENVANYLHGKEPLSSIGAPLGTVFITQALVGLSFSVFGVNPVASALVLTLVKLLTLVGIYRLGKAMFDGRTGLVGGFVYLFSPTILYYTTVFYKEAVIHLFVCAVMLAACNLYSDSRRWKWWLILAVAVAGVANERFYLFFIFAATLVPLALMRTARAHRWYLAAVVAAAIFLAYPVVGKYVDIIVGGHVSLKNLLKVLEDYRAVYSSYSDVAPINSSVPYPAAFLKILFTPFFTLNKFSLFSDYSYMLIWGSFFNQAVILLSLGGIFAAIKTDRARNWFLVFPYFLFLCLFAYIAPYNGRLRDSFYPVIAVFAASALQLLWKKKT